MVSNQKTIIIFILLLLLVVSCTDGAPPTGTAAPGISTQTITSTAEFQNTVTNETLPTQTATSVSTMTPVPTVVILNQVTPPVQDENKWTYIQDLMENNGYCNLPCLWGITPGVTTWESIEPFLLSIADEIGYGNETTLSVNNSLYTLYSHYYRYRLEGYSGILAINILTDPVGIVNVITTRVPLTSKKFEISQVLADYGEPAEILLDSTDKYPPGRKWYWIVLLYPEYGFAAFYQGEGESADEGIRSCPGTTGPYLSLFSYEDMTVETLAALVKRTIFSDVGLPGSISEMPGLTITGVYNELLDPSGCITIPLLDYLR